jgi:hypothetical protein
MRLVSKMRMELSDWRNNFASHTAWKGIRRLRRKAVRIAFLNLIENG